MNDLSTMLDAVIDNFDFFLKVLQPLMATAGGGGVWALLTSCYIILRFICDRQFCLFSKSVTTSDSYRRVCVSFAHFLLYYTSFDLW